MTADVQSRCRGALLGLAVGDAVGTTVEFQAPGTFEPLTDMVGGGPFRLRPGQWTDDTSMALCLAESLLLRRGFDPVDQLERYVAWWRTGHWSSTGRCFDIGGTVRAALRRFEHSRAPYCGPASPDTAGNGSLMRLAPVPIFYREDEAAAVHFSGESSRTTHQAQTAVDACRFMGRLLCRALNGADKDQTLSDTGAGLDLHPEIAEVATGSYRQRQPPQIEGTGFVVRSLEAALWALHHAGSFREGCLLAANLGNDADTTAAIYGQLAGAIWGDEAIPQAWLARLSARAAITAMADRLATNGRDVA